MQLSSSVPDPIPGSVPSVGSTPAVVAPIGANTPTVITPEDGPSAPAPGASAEPEPVPEPEPAPPVHCRHCGEEAPEGTAADSDWLCSDCGRHQSTMVCPTCKSIVATDQMPKDMVPAAHAPKKRRKAKE